MPRGLKGLGRMVAMEMGGGGFLPSHLPSLKLWLDASKITGLADGAAVASWADASGLGNHATQGTADNQPVYKTNVINGRPVVRFDGTNDYLTTASFLDTGYNIAFTCYAVAPTSPISSQRLFISNQLAKFFISGITVNGEVNSTFDFKMTGLNNTDHYWYHPFDDPLLDAKYWSNPRQIIGVSYNGSAQTLMLNGVVKTWAATGNLGLSGAFTIGARSTPDLYWSGDIAEIVVYNAAHAPAQMRQVQQYLAAKYGLTLKARNYVLVGDSHTAGSASESGRGYPGKLLDITPNSSDIIVYNNGYQGRTVLTMNGLEAYYIQPYMASYAKNIAVVWGGVNDEQAGADAATIWGRLQHLSAAMKAGGFQTVLCTEIDAQNRMTWHNTVWPALNTLIRENYASCADGLADLGANAALQNATNTTYYHADKLHLVDAGNAVVAGIIKAAIDALP